MSTYRSHNDIALLEDLQAVLLDCLIETGLHKIYQAGILNSLPGEVRGRVELLLREDKETMDYLNSRVRSGLEILGQARRYNPDRAAVRLCPRPLALEVVP